MANSSAGGRQFLLLMANSSVGWDASHHDGGPHPLTQWQQRQGLFAGLSGRFASRPSGHHLLSFAPRRFSVSYLLAIILRLTTLNFVVHCSLCSPFAESDVFSDISAAKTGSFVGRLINNMGEFHAISFVFFM